MAVGFGQESDSIYSSTVSTKCWNAVFQPTVVVESSSSPCKTANLYILDIERLPMWLPMQQGVMAPGYVRSYQPAHLQAAANHIV